MGRGRGRLRPVQEVAPLRLRSLPLGLGDTCGFIRWLGPPGAATAKSPAWATYLGFIPASWTLASETQAWAGLVSPAASARFSRRVFPWSSRVRATPGVQFYSLVRTLLRLEQGLCSSRILTGSAPREACVRKELSCWCWGSDMRSRGGCRQPSGGLCAVFASRVHTSGEVTYAESVASVPRGRPSPRGSCLLLAVPSAMDVNTRPRGLPPRSRQEAEAWRAR